MNITDLYTAESHENGSEVNIINPFDGNPTDIYIKVQGVDSKAFREAKRKSYRNALENPDSYDSDKTTCEILADITVGWRGVESDGKDLEFSKEKAFELYENAPAIRDQIDTYISNRANFTNG